MPEQNTRLHSRKEVMDLKLENVELVYQTCERPMLLTDCHYHSAVEIIYILDGVLTVMVGESYHLMKPGEMIVINSEENHAVFISDYGVHRTFAVKFIPETICSEKQSFEELQFIIPYILSSPNFKRYYTEKEVEESHIKQLLEDIMRTDREREFAYHFSIRILVSQILLYLIRFNEQNLPEGETDDFLRKKLIDVFQYISVHYAEKITAASLAKQFHIRQMDLSSTFKKMTGKTFHEYLIYIRICKAKLLLLNTDMNIAEISDAVGFSYTNYFIKCFKKQMGMTPLSFKKMPADLPTSIYVVP